MLVQPGTRSTLDVRRRKDVEVEAWVWPTWEFEVRENRRGAESPDCLDENCGQSCEVMEVKGLISCGGYYWSGLDWIVMIKRALQLPARCLGSAQVAPMTFFRAESLKRGTRGATPPLVAH